MVSGSVGELDVELRWVELAEFTPDGGWGLRYRSIRSLLAWWKVVRTTLPGPGKIAGQGSSPVTTASPRTPISGKSNEIVTNTDSASISAINHRTSCSSANSGRRGTSGTSVGKDLRNRDELAAVESDVFWRSSSSRN